MSESMEEPEVNGVKALETSQPRPDTKRVYEKVSNKTKDKTSNNKTKKQNAKVGANEDHSLNGLANGKDSVSSGPDSKTAMQDNPNWSETKTKAGKDRKRLPLACIACRRKKIRCSGEKPACKHCVRARTPCIYKQTARKFVPRTDYMATLDKRMKRMEERLLKYVSKDQASALGPIARSVVKPSPSLLQNVADAQKNNRKRSAEKAFGSEETKKKPTIIPKPSGSSQAIAVKRTQGDVSDEMLEEGKDKLPSRDIQEHLAEVYFECVYGQTYLLLHKPSFMRRLRNGSVPPVLILALCAVSARYSTHPAVRKDTPFIAGEEWGIEAGRIVRENFDKANLTNLTVLLLLGLHELGTCNGGKSWAYGGMAMRMAYALQLHHEMDDDPLGFIRSNQSNSQTTPKTPMSFTDREIRRRLMWACFFMDRFNSSGTSRPQFLDEADIHIQLPIKERLFVTERPGLTEYMDGSVREIEGVRDDLKAVNQNMGISAYIVRVVALWGRVMKYLNHGGKERDVAPVWLPTSKFADLNQQANTLKDSLPESLIYSEKNLNAHAAEKLEGQFLFLHIACHQVFLMLHRFSIPLRPGAKPAVGYPMDFLRSSVQTSFKAANTIATIFADGLDRDYGIYAPFMGYTSFAAATIHVVGSFSKNPSIVITAKRNLTVCVRYLTKMARFWGVLYPLWDNLRDQYELQARAVRSPGSVDIDLGEEPSSILQYGDWFTRFPRGVDQTIRPIDGERLLPGERVTVDEVLEKPESLDELVKKEQETDPVMRKGSDLETPDEFLKKLQEAAAISASMKKTMKKKTTSKSATSSHPVQPQLSHIRTGSLAGKPPATTLPRQTGNNNKVNGMTPVRRHSMIDPRGSSAQLGFNTEVAAFENYAPHSAIDGKSPFSVNQPSPTSATSDGPVRFTNYPADQVQIANTSSANYPVPHITFNGPGLNQGNHGLEPTWPYHPGNLSDAFTGASPAFAGHFGEFVAPVDGFTAPHEELLAAQDNGWFLPFNFSPPGSEGMDFSLGSGLQQVFDGVVGTSHNESGTMSDVMQQPGTENSPGLGFMG